MTQDTENLSDRLNIQVNDQDIEIYMSFALLNLLVTPIVDIDTLNEMDSNPDLRTYVLQTCLAERDKNGTVTKNMDLHNISMKNGEKILSWAKGHITAFFIQRLMNRVKTQQKINQALEKY